MFRPAFVPLILAGAALAAPGCGSARHVAPPRPAASAAAPGPKVTIVDRDHDLRTPGLWVHVLKVKTGSVLLPRSTYGEISRAKGRFLFVGVALKNVGDQPLDSLDLAQLKVDGRTYDQDFGAEFEVMPADAFPLQPGEEGAAALVFDVPAAAAEAAAQRGVLVLPSEPDPNTAERLGEIRLGPAASTPLLGPMA